MINSKTVALEMSIHLRKNRRRAMEKPVLARERNSEYE
jgi:hypothetical protein